MIGSRGIGILVIAIALGLTVAPLASATVGAPDGTADGTGLAVAGSATAADEASANGSNASNVSTFMQSSSADVEATIDAELFEASFESADEDERADVVTARIDQLEERIASLEAEREELESMKDELNEPAYNARMTRFTVQLAALEDAIDAAEERAADTDGVDPEGVAELRSKASELAGQDVAEIATGLAGVDPPGQSDDHPQKESPPGQSDGTDAHEEDEPGAPSDDDTGGPPNDDTGAPPVDGGQ